MIKEQFIKQRMEIDKVTRKYFDKNYIVIECDCGKSYCNGWRCLTKSDINDENLFNYIKKIENEKKQFISWLEDKIKEYQEELSNSWMEDEENDFSFELKIKIEMLKEVLDFVNKGGKDE